MIYRADAEISYYDLDAQGNLKLTALLKHINLAAGRSAEELGVGLEATLPMGLAFVIQRFGLRIERLPAHGEIVKIRTWPAEIARGTFRRNGDMYDADGKKIAEWTGLWVLIDIHARKVKRPQALPVELPSHGSLGTAVEAARLAPQEFAEGALLAESTYKVRYSDLDTYQHMNNAIYGDLVANMVHASGSSLVATPTWREVQINYIAETKLDDDIKLACFKQGEETLNISGYVKDRAVFAARILV